MNFFKKLFQECPQSAKQFGRQSGNGAYMYISDGAFVTIDMSMYFFLRGIILKDNDSLEEWSGFFLHLRRL